MTTTITITDPENDKCSVCGKAFSPLPEMIAGLAALLRSGNPRLHDDAVRNQIANTLQAQARQVADLHENLQWLESAEAEIKDRDDKLDQQAREIEQLKEGLRTTVGEKDHATIWAGQQTIKLKETEDRLIAKTREASGYAARIAELEDVMRELMPKDIAEHPNDYVPEWQKAHAVLNRPTHFVDQASRIERLRGALDRIARFDETFAEVANKHEENAGALMAETLARYARATLGQDANEDRP